MNDAEFKSIMEAMEEDETGKIHTREPVGMNLDLKI